jgi:hypothetical protein
MCTACCCRSMARIVAGSRHILIFLFGIGRKRETLEIASLEHPGLLSDASPESAMACLDDLMMHG